LTAARDRFSLRFAAAVVVATIVLAALFWNDRIIAGNRLVDVVAFACGGSVYAQGGDPYLVHPLTECEDAARAFGLAWPTGVLTLPAPLPAYALVPFALASRVAPFAVVAWSWIALNIVCVGLAAALLRRRLPTIPPLTIAAFTIVSTLPVGLLYGQFTGVVLLAIVASGELLARGSPRRAALCLAVAMLQPHVGLAPMIALFVLVPRSRLTIVACTMALAALSVWPHPALATEYVFRVLGAHARANLPDFSQYSLPSVLAIAHVPAGAALAAGDAFFVVAIVAAILAARALAARTGRPEAIPWIAAAVGTIAAPHLHLQQLACALPGIALAFEAGGEAAWVLVALTAFAIPWARFALSFGGAFAAGAAAFTIVLRPLSRRAAAYAATAAAALAIALMVAFVRTAHMDRIARDVPVTGNPLAEVPWSQTMVRMDGALHASAVLVRVPTWLAMIAVLAAIAFAISSSRKSRTG
jgi:hypothetical protein